MTAIERTAYPRFKHILSAKDLAEVYTPTPGERLTAHRSTKGRVAEVGFLVLLKTYQRLGRFVPLSEVPSVCKVAMANLAMWVRDRYFPASYAQATWKRLLPFFQLPGTITYHAQTVQVELRPFNDRALNRDLAILCERVNQASPHLPDGRQLSFTIGSVRCILAAQKKAKIL